jgi:2-polyprenyl-3-methyl-5-hydroxy-6-metoxy-1,4-benzoquinol methylase
MEEHQHCTICGSANISPLYSVNGFSIVRCGDCTLVFVKEKLTDQELAPAYELIESDYIYSDPANIANLEYYYLRLRKLIQGYVPSGRILDLGCSEGRFLDSMDGWERFGIELPGPAAEKAVSKYGNNIFLGTIQGSDFPNSYFDVITLQDVFDHVIDPIDTLRHCNRILRPSGLIVVKVHDISSIFARISGSKYYAIIPPYHLSYFNKKSLRIALEKTGFAWIDHKYIAHVLMLKTIPYRLSRGDQKSLFYRAYRLLNGSSLATIRVHKNMYDIVTVFARKNALA